MILSSISCFPWAHCSIRCFFFTLASLIVLSFQIKLIPFPSLVVEARVSRYTEINLVRLLITLHPGFYPIHVVSGDPVACSVLSSYCCITAVLLTWTPIHLNFRLTHSHFPGLCPDCKTLNAIRLNIAFLATADTATSHTCKLIAFSLADYSEKKPMMVRLGWRVIWRVFSSALSFMSTSESMPRLSRSILLVSSYSS